MGSRRNWDHSTMFIGDNLDFMRGMNSGNIDLIFLDPPFNSNHNYAAPIDSEAAGAAFKDTWTLRDIDDSWYGYIADKHPALHSLIQVSGEIHSDSMKSYLIYMAIRILEMKRLLKDTGSIFLHCDPKASHYLKLTMDAIFGSTHIRNEVIWHYYNGTSNIRRAYVRKHDSLLFYTKKVNQNYFDEEEAREPYAPDSNFVKNPKGYKDKYRPNPKGKRKHDVWRIPTINNMAKERTGYPTQKPLALLHQVIKASSKEGDIVFDPFCGCATACVAAQFLNRKWIGCDISPLAGELVESRMTRELGLFFDGKITDTPPKRTKNDLSNEENKLFAEVKLGKYNSLNNKWNLYGKQMGVCKGCGQEFRFKILEVDHVIPRSKGGSDHISNLQLLCPNCNRRKGDRSMDEFVDLIMQEKQEEMQRMQLFHGKSSDE